MNQCELLQWFQNKWNQGDKKYWSIREIENEMPLDTSIGRKVTRLYAWGYLETDFDMRWKRKFRIKAKYRHLKIGDFKSPLDSDITMSEYQELGRN